MKKSVVLISVAIAFFAPAVMAQVGKGIDGKKPIEINSDELEVQQENNLAIFRGHVVAVQGETRLSSDEMTVHYKKKEAEADPNPGATHSTVERIEVQGNVLLANPTETAAGDRGVYDVANKQVRLFDHVVLTRGQNVLKGDSLVYDTETGKSVVNSPHHTEGQSGRVRALFVPEKKE